MANDIQRRAEQLFQHVVDLPPGERSAYLDEHSDDPAVRREIGELLAHSDAGSGDSSGESSGESCENVIEVIDGDHDSVSQINLPIVPPRKRCHPS